MGKHLTDQMVIDAVLGVDRRRRELMPGDLVTTGFLDPKLQARAQRKLIDLGWAREFLSRFPSEREYGPPSSKLDLRLTTSGYLRL